MKALVTALCFTFLACASNATKIPPPELTFVQLSGPAEQSYPQGDFEVHYGLRITNRAAEAITLRRIQLTTAGLGGPYELVPRAYELRQVVQPGQTEDVAFWAKAFSTGDGGSIDATAPITVRTTVFFDAPSGDFRRVFTTIVSQRGE